MYWILGLYFFVINSIIEIYSNYRCKNKLFHQCVSCKMFSCSGDQIRYYKIKH